MTYVESPTTRSPYINNNKGPAYSVIPPPRTPSVGVPVRQSPKALDYWNKAEDRAGITYYWTTRNQPAPGWAPKSLPRLAPFPTNGDPYAQPKNILPVYQNVTSLPRARIPQSKSMPEATGLRLTPDLPHSQTSYVLKDTNGVAPSQVPNEKKRPTRRKLKWGRCVSSLFCCVAPQRELDKNGNATPSQPASVPSTLSTTSTAEPSRTTSPAESLIYQVTKDSPTPALPVAQISRPIDQDVRNRATLPPRLLPRDTRPPLLPPQRPCDIGKITLILDLDETLVHSSFNPVQNPDYVIPIEINGSIENAYVLKRPYVDEFLARVGEKFECVLFTASLSKYAGPVADLLDQRGAFRARLFREACDYNVDSYVKNLDRLGRDVNRTLIVDNSPASYAMHTRNAVAIKTWFDDPRDTELLKIIPRLEEYLEYDSVYDVPVEYQ